MYGQGEIRSILEKKERRKLFSRLQALAEEEGQIPTMPCFLLRKMCYPLQYSGGILFGIFIGIVTFFLNFIIFVLLFHIEL